MNSLNNKQTTIGKDAESSHLNEDEDESKL